MTRGEHIAQAVREYLASNGITQAKLTGSILATIADDVLAHLEKVQAKQKRLATEEDWILELEREPHLAGVNVRKELAGAQFWCKNNARACTRRFFVNWLGKAERSAVISPGGVNAPSGGKPGLQGPRGWLAALKETFPDCAQVQPGGDFEITAETDYQWSRLPADVRAKIVSALRQELV